MYFESHAHYDDEAFDIDREQLLRQLPEKGIDYVMQTAACMKSSLKSIQLAERYPYIAASVGVHPGEIEGLQEEDMIQLENWCSHAKVRAVGEIGLDYHYDRSPETKKKQQYWFIRQLILAERVDLPVIIHSREACEDTFNVISRSGVSKGVVHCYGGSLEMARKYVEMGFFIGVGGVITFKNAKKLVEVVEGIPLEKILLETDSPYLSPVPHRGSRNDSRNLPLIAEKIGQIKQKTIEEIAWQTKENAAGLFC